MNTSIAPGQRWPLILTLFAVVFAVYMATYSRALDVHADEGAMFCVIENIVKFGHVNIDQINNLQSIPPSVIGPDGLRYAKYGLGQSLAAAPLYGLGLALPVLGLVDMVLLLNPLVGALTAAVLMLTALELGASRKRALAVTLIYALCTTAWVYAKNFYSEPLAGLGFALACWGVAIMLVRQPPKDFSANASCRSARKPQLSGAALAGAGLGLAILVKSSAVVTAPVLLLVVLRYGGSRRWRLACAAAAPIMVAVIIVCLYNWARFGDPANSGYGQETFSVYPWVGAWGMLFAPGRSLFIYAPIMLAAVPGVWASRRPAGLRLWIIGTALAMLLVHGAWWSWWGAWSWGPRFLVPVLPLLSLGLLPVFDWAAQRGAWARWGLSLLVALSFVIQLPGVLVNRILFFWEVMNLNGPNTLPDEVSLYTLRYFMPLSNLRMALNGNLDLAWKPGTSAPVDRVGLLLVSTSLLIGIVGLYVAWRSGRIGHVAALLCPLLVFGVALGNLAHYQRRDTNPFRALPSAVAAIVPPGAVVLVGGNTPESNQQFWNVNRSALRLVGVPADPTEFQLYTLPVVRRSARTAGPVWYLQIGDNQPAALLSTLHAAGLCPTTYLTDASARLIGWNSCDPEIQDQGDDRSFRSLLPR